MLHDFSCFYVVQLLRRSLCTRRFRYVDINTGAAWTVMSGISHSRNHGSAFNVFRRIELIVLEVTDGVGHLGILPLNDVFEVKFQRGRLFDFRQI
jgi:hypothetical protein